MTNLQIIHSPNGEEMVVLSRQEYDQLIHRAYDAADSQDAALAAIQLEKIQTGKTALIPAPVAHAIAIDGVHPIKAWRDYHGWTGAELAQKTKLARTTISQIETGKRKGTVAAYKALAKAFGTSVTSLIE